MKITNKQPLYQALVDSPSKEIYFRPGFCKLDVVFPDDYFLYVRTSNQTGTATLPFSISPSSLKKLKAYLKLKTSEIIILKNHIHLKKKGKEELLPIYPIDLPIQIYEVERMQIKSSMIIDNLDEVNTIYEFESIEVTLGMNYNSTYAKTLKKLFDGSCLCAKSTCGRYLKFYLEDRAFYTKNLIEV